MIQSFGDFSRLNVHFKLYSLLPFFPGLEKHFGQEKYMQLRAKKWINEKGIGVYFYDEYNHSSS